MVESVICVARKIQACLRMLLMIFFLAPPAFIGTVHGNMRTPHPEGLPSIWLFRTATDAVDKALMYAYRDRRARKRDFRRLWITRINAAARMNNLSYSKFIHGLKLAGIELDRKVLAELAVSDPSGFAQVASLASQQL